MNFIMWSIKKYVVKRCNDFRDNVDEYWFPWLLVSLCLSIIIDVFILNLAWAMSKTNDPSGHFNPMALIAWVLFWGWMLSMWLARYLLANYESYRSEYDDLEKPKAKRNGKKMASFDELFEGYEEASIKPKPPSSYGTYMKCEQFGERPGGGRISKG